MRITQISEAFGSTIEGSPQEKVGDIDPNVVRDLIKTRGTVIFAASAPPSPSSSSLFGSSAPTS